MISGRSWLTGWLFFFPPFTFPQITTPQCSVCSTHDFSVLSYSRIVQSMCGCVWAALQLTVDGYNAYVQNMNMASAYLLPPPLKDGREMKCVWRHTDPTVRHRMECKYGCAYCHAHVLIKHLRSHTEYVQAWICARNCRGHVFYLQSILPFN